MAGPYRAINLKVEIIDGANTYTVGVVDGLDIDLSFDGGAEPYYGSITRKHSSGCKKVSLTLSRWYFADEDQQDLLLSLFNSRTEFNLRGSLITNSGQPIPNSAIVIKNVLLYKYRPKTGSANDIIGEEASGEALDWEFEALES